VISLRKYEELKVDILTKRIQASPVMKRYIPDCPPTKKLDKLYLLAVLFPKLEKF